MNTDIANTYKEAELLKVNIINPEDRIKSAGLLAAPAEGWPGKNEEQRAIAREHQLSGDEHYTDLVEQLRFNRVLLGKALGDIATFEAERREREWATRQRYVELLQTRTGAQIIPGEDILWGQR